MDLRQTKFPIESLSTVMSVPGGDNRKPVINTMNYEHIDNLSSESIKDAIETQIVYLNNSIEATSPNTNYIESLVIYEQLNELRNISYVEAIDDIRLGIQQNIIALNLDKFDMTSDFCLDHAKHIIKKLDVDGTSLKNTISLSEVASITLYTMESPFYRMFNKVLRETTSLDIIQPYFKYSVLFLNALSKCPIYKGRMVYRAIRDNLSSEYIKNKVITWRSFSSATSNIAVELNFLSKGSIGNTNSILQGTLFHIELKTHRSRQVNKYSMVTSEEEVIFPFFSEFRVIECLDTGSGLIIVQLQEINPSVKLFIDFECDNTSTISENSNVNDFEATREKIAVAFKNTLQAIRDFAIDASETLAVAMDQLIIKYDDDYQRRRKIELDEITNCSSIDSTKTSSSSQKIIQKNNLDQFSESQVLLIQKMVDLGFPIDKIKEALVAGCDSEIKIMEYLIPPPLSVPNHAELELLSSSSSRARSSSTIPNITIDSSHKNQTLSSSSSSSSLPSSSYGFDSWLTATQSWITTSVPNINITNTIETLSSQKNIMDGWFSSLSSSSSSSTVNPPPVTSSHNNNNSNNRRTNNTNNSSHTKRESTSSVSGDKIYLEERKKILSMNQQQVNTLPIQDVRKYLRFLLVTHSFEDPHDKLRDILWKAIVRNR